MGAMNMAEESAEPAGRRSAQMRVGGCKCRCRSKGPRTGVTKPVVTGRRRYRRDQALKSDPGQHCQQSRGAKPPRGGVQTPHVTEEAC